MGRVHAALAMTPPALAVNEIFGPTFQGEGPTSGSRAAFVRLARCNLSCVWCDTAYTWDWSRYDPQVEVHPMAADAVLAAVDAMGVERLVITGGEPLLQQESLLPLLEGCEQRGWIVEVETNGTRAPLPAVEALVHQFNVAIKLSNSGLQERVRIRPTAIRVLVRTEKAVFKFVAEEPDDLDEVSMLVEDFDLEPVWIMPEGTTPAIVTERIRCLAEPVLARGWNMGSRLHVLAWGNERGR